MIALVLPAFLLASCKGSGDVDRTISYEFIAQLEDSFCADSVVLWDSVKSHSVKSLAQVDKDSVYSLDFAVTVPLHGITDQENSGRCWLFSTLNILRSELIRDKGIRGFEFSQTYGQFWDVLEKSNRFMEDVIEFRDRPMDDRTNWWLFRKPIGDGGHFTNAAHIIEKYGVVPKDVMPETYASSNNGELMDLVRSQLRRYGMKLRSCEGGIEELERVKKEGLTDIYRILVLTLGKPPVSFSWSVEDPGTGEAVTSEYTPKSFKNEFVSHDMHYDYFIMMNDPTRDYYKLYEVGHNRNCYEGDNWKFVNLPVDEIKKIAVASLRGRTAMYFSCDVDKFYERTKGVLDVDAYDYASVLGVDFDMDKRGRVLSVDSMSDHAMTLAGVDFDIDGNPSRWLVENSFGDNNQNGGFLIMTDEWFEEYLFRFVAEKQYVPKEILDIAGGKALQIPAWNPTY